LLHHTHFDVKGGVRTFAAGASDITADGRSGHSAVAFLAFVG
jgi:hypothetical protein